MSSNSTNEEESVVLNQCDENKDYMGTCDDEVNDMVPRLKRLCINDDPMNLPPNDMSILAFSMDTDKSSEKNSIADSKENVSLAFVGDASNNVMVTEAIKAVVVSKQSLFGSENPSPIISTNTPVEIQPQDFIGKAAAGQNINMNLIDPKEQMLGKHKEPKEIRTENAVDENSLNLSLKLNLDHNYFKPTSQMYKDKTDPQPSAVALEKSKFIDPDTGEVMENSNILSDTPGCDNIGTTMEHFADDLAGGIMLSVDSSTLSYSADESHSDDQLRSSSVYVPFSTADTTDTSARNATSTEYTRSRRNAVFEPPALGVNENKQRRLSTFQPPSGIIDAKEPTKTNSSSDELSKKSTAIGEKSPTSYRRKGKKAVKISLRPKPPNRLDEGNGEKKRPGPCKRKKISSENTTQATGKILKRSLSDQNSETREKSLLNRSRSLSPDSKKNQSTSIINRPSKIPIALSRKRAISDCQNLSRNKSRRSDSSDAYNK